MPLTAAQRRAVSRRTTASSRQRLRARYGQKKQGPLRPVGNPLQQAGFGRAPVFSQAPRPATPGVVPQSPAPGAGQGAAGAPRQFVPDAQYLAQAGQAQFERQTRLNELSAEGEAQRTATQEAIRRMMEDAPDQRREVSQAANKQGLFYSGQLGKRLGDLETQLSRQRADVQSQFDAGQRAREAARTAILAGVPLEEAALRAEAAERRIAHDSEAAASNSLAPTPVPKKPKPKGKLPKVPKAKKRRRKKR